MRTIDALIEKFKEVREELSKNALHDNIPGFVSALRAIPREDAAARGRFITAHMNHPAFQAALQVHPQGGQIRQQLNAHLNSVQNAGFKPGATRTTVGSDTATVGLPSVAPAVAPVSLDEVNRAKAPVKEVNFPAQALNAQPKNKVAHSYHPSDIPTRASRSLDTWNPDAPDPVAPPAPKRQFTMDDLKAARAQMAAKVNKTEDDVKKNVNQSYEDPANLAMSERLELAKNGQWNLADVSKEHEKWKKAGKPGQYASMDTSKPATHAVDHDDGEIKPIVADSETFKVENNGQWSLSKDCGTNEPAIGKDDKALQGDKD